jgi:peptide/nickel transport system substrate-binding protein
MRFTGITGFVVLASISSGCAQRPASDPDILVVGVTSGPNNLDPRVATDDTSQKADQLIFNGLMAFDEHLRIVPDLAERLDNPDPTTYIVTLRKNVRFHDGHELTSADVVYTYRSLLDPALRSPLGGANRMLDTVVARDRYTVVFTLTEPFGSFPVNLVQPGIVPDGAGLSVEDHPIGTGPYRFVRYAVDDQLELTSFDGYFEGRPHNRGLIIKIVPDTIMCGLELRKGTMDVVINDLEPDLVYQLEQEPRLQVVRSPGTDYQYMGVNLQDPVLKDERIRQAIAYAIDRGAIVKYLRRGFATPAAGMLPPISWAFDEHLPDFAYAPDKARALLDAAGYPDPDGDGPAPRLRLTLKMSSVEFNRLQAAVIQQNLRAVGIAIDVRTYEFATLYADVLKGSFQLYFLQWTGGSVADPDILRRVFHSAQAPPVGFNRGHFFNPDVDRLLDEASVTISDTDRRARYDRVQEVIAGQVPYVSLWHKTNAVVAQRSLTGIRMLPTADFAFLKDVTRVVSR